MCVSNDIPSQSFKAGGVGIPPRQHPGASTLEGLADAFARDTYILNQKTQLAQWQADQNVKEVCQRFLISRIESVYL